MCSFAFSSYLRSLFYFFHLQYTNFWDHAYNGETPPIVRDPYWDADDINLPAKITMPEGNDGAGHWFHRISFSASEDPFRGSLASINFADRRRMSVFGSKSVS